MTADGNPPESGAAGGELAGEIRALIERFPNELSPAEAPAVIEHLAGQSGRGDLPDVLLVDAGESANIRAILGALGVPERLKAALFGSLVCRGLLIRDANKLIQLCVLKNPKLTVGEVEEFARNPNLSDGVLRAIADNREWMRSYEVKRGLVMNPKTPGDVGLKWVRYLNLSDLKALAGSRDVPQLIAQAARRRLLEAQKR